MKPITIPCTHALVFAGSVLLGMWLRCEQVAHAWGPNCEVNAQADLIEVRRVEGNGDIDVQQATWHEYLSLGKSKGGAVKLHFADDVLPEDLFVLELEEAP